MCTYVCGRCVSLRHPLSTARGLSCRVETQTRILTGAAPYAFALVPQGLGLCPAPSNPTIKGRGLAVTALPVIENRLSPGSVPSYAN